MEAPESNEAQEFWNQILKAARAPFSITDVLEIADFKSTSYDNDEMTFEAILTLKDKSRTALKARHSPTHGEIFEATLSPA